MAKKSKILSQVLEIITVLKKKKRFENFIAHVKAEVDIKNVLNKKP